ncbi:borealin-2 isoform X2 [Oncorhynchus kisutch]|uniref:borealin-2 isoform X2 n=1 Tax=Oncorhynchus kisutch TaxID=8019 RepID=UPI00099F7178|nr:borealin-2 isoform X2 [Oncorhynchus kisutch]
MAPRRIRKVSNQSDGQISKEIRQKQGVLFIQQFEKEVVSPRPFLADDISAGEVTIAIKTVSPEIHQPLTRKLSKVKVSEGASAHKRKATTEPSKGSKKARSLANSSSTGSLRCATPTNAKRTKTRLAKISDQSPLTGTKPRSVLRSASDDYLYCSLPGLSPHVMISTSHGETLCLSDDTVEDVDIGLLDDMAVLQMQKLMKLMDYLFNKVKANQPLSVQ